MNGHTVLLRSDGRAVACGYNVDGQCDIPALEDGMTYLQVSGGVGHTVLLRRDGHAVACGSNLQGQCDIPTLEGGNYADKPGVWLYDELVCTLKKGGLHRVCRRGAISKRHKQSNMVALPKAIILNIPASALAALFVFSAFTFALRRICKPASATAKETLLAVN